jgi:glycosyltransferase involved in cell wall biosynthesis
MEGVFLDDLASDVPVYEIQPKDYGILHRNWRRYRGLEALYKRVRPALVMSIKWQVNAAVLLGSLFSQVNFPILINEQGVPSASLADGDRPPATWALTRRVYHRAGRVIVISRGIADELVKHTRVPQSKIEVIHNPIDMQGIQAQAQNQPQFTTPGSSTIISAGRLIKLKNYPLLVRAVRNVLEEHLVDLYILGQGPEKDSILELSQALGIADRVHLLGFKPQPYAYIAQADLFALTSDHEGFGNVLVEAMALGLPVVSTDCPYGPAEILGNGEFGVLVPVNDENALSEALLGLLTDGHERLKYAQKSRQRAEDFTIEKIVPRYEKLFLEMIGG